jgi:DNA primase
LAGRIRQDDVDAVRERTDLVKVVSGHLQLKKAGRDSMVGLCPFHAEKTGSFSVSPAKQVYYCFGCGEGGDVFKFVQKVENLSFAEAVDKLAKEAGITVRHEGQTPADRKAAGRRGVLHRANADAAHLYHRILLEAPEGADARGYLQARGITKESMERFDVGYAPGHPDFLLKRLSKTYSPELLVEAGLVADAGGTLKDRFRGRVTFPVHDLSGNAVAIGGRLLQPKDRPAIEAAKYVNSPETPVYHKGSILYNLNRAKADPTRLGRACLVVEGYTDVIALDQAGIPAAVATCGTALGEDHLRVLSRFTDRVILAFDSDEAGAKAAERAFRYHQQYAIDILVLILPQGQDPADFALAKGDAAGEAFQALTATAVPLVEYMIGRTLIGRDLQDVEGRARAVRDGLALVATLEDPVRREQYANVLADRVGVSAGSVMLEMSQHRVSAGPDGRGTPDRPQAPRRSPYERVEREALKLLVQSAEVRGRRLGLLSADRFASPSCRKVFEFLMSSPAGADVAGLVAGAEERSETLGKLVAALAMEPLEWGEQPSGEYEQAVFLRLEEFDLKRQIEELRKKLERLNPLTSGEEHRALFEQFSALEGARRRVRAAAEAGAAGR